MSEKRKKWVEPEIPVKPDEEIKQLAIDINEGRVYTSEFHGESAIEAFMVWRLWIDQAIHETDVTPEQLKEYGAKMGMLYEYLDQAAPMSINGRPSFLSYKILPKENMELLLECLQKLEKAKSEL